MIALSAQARRDILAYARKTCPVGGGVALATRADIADLAELDRICFPVNPVSRRGIRHSIGPGKSLIVLHRDKKGVLTSFCLIEFYKRQRRSYFSAYCAAPAFRGRGLGRWQMGLYEYISRRLGCRVLTSHAALKNRKSIRLHLESGFEVVRKIPDYYDDGSGGCYLRKEIKA